MSKTSSPVITECGKIGSTPIVYNDIIIQTSNLRPGSTPPAFTAFKDSIFGFSFINAQSDEMHGGFEIPHDYKEGTELEVHVHWSPSSTDTGNCVWTFSYSKLTAGSGAPSETVLTASTGIAGGGVALAPQYTTIGTIAGTAYKIGEIVTFRIARPSGDSFTGDAFLHSVGVHYMSDTTGSLSRSTKA